jgi:hypothetical protein
LFSCRTSICDTRILGSYWPLILAPAEGSSLEPCPLDLMGWGLTKEKNVQTKY